MVGHIVHPATSWDQMQNIFYCKPEIYSMLWRNIDLSKYLIAGAPNGGPIALIRDDRKIQVVQKQMTATPVLSIYTASGKLLNQIQWDKGRIVKLGWTKSERLVCILEDGTVRIYHINGECNQFSLGKVIDVHAFGPTRFS
ncbi:hypothetical protein K493DRAFT_2227 [Basidiobolus meristosporus CBS 931.73]|uniref:Vps16 N-terminal domain-containing protein n=1 Tax=Basidiobolus meristosporus CBS 931.73 TaxID=1314790 RepID=A0A1Y1WQ12_9FUNG|nr:hypothetical protein K493DRAFT_2227 [Basidiobolus meristosporus CBS 931.73]|eukprot:ORX75378.1 hypothetical protein K493DRAFT_2227 [Basidiobolus meristosporus CBS 931.73]